MSCCCCKFVAINLLPVMGEAAAVDACDDGIM
jgi:hypothetical protein